ncbi:MAG TPA: pseudouridine synthase [Tepidisphaeraceae bacterium]|jgi:23S rRNA pseudouridine2605 synthase|nr:pseudouridine synthase [Tepidisphaeraceae bacterium]
MKERIQKVLASVGVASRRAIEDMIRDGRVAVNGKVETSLPIMVDAAVDKIKIDGEAVRIKGTDTTKKYYVLMNKPKGVYSTNVAQGAQTRAIDLLPEDFPARVYPVGRLDSESKGLLLLTNDGELTNLLTHPRYGVSKTYRAVVDGWVKEELIEQMREGVWLSEKEGGKAYKANVKYARIYKRGRDKSVLDITIRESRNRQLRRMLARLGHKVRELTRIKMGPLTLEGIQPGGMRMLTGKEIRELRESVERKAKKDGDPREEKKSDKD